ncbi:antitoxin MazE family protein [Brevundimonas balnearis]|uniref:Antitoxin MazE family protein n=1 Tax=Brevundimonas balnearis TaxID=1572858 RepID=A0ABV6R272_9CAUL
MSSSAKRVAQHRATLRAQGLRPVQIWVPDTRAPGYWEAIERQLAALKTSEAERKALKELDEFLDWDDED